MPKETLDKVCRVCLAEAHFNIFDDASSPAWSSLFQQNQDPARKQYERLAEKLRFVGMIPVRNSNSMHFLSPIISYVNSDTRTYSQVVESSVFPNMLCYTCVVQLNLAYNFKNLIISTNLHLERLIIENGICAESSSRPPQPEPMLALTRATGTYDTPTPPPPRQPTVPSIQAGAASSMTSTKSSPTTSEALRTLVSDTESTTRISEIMGVSDIKKEIEVESEWDDGSSSIVQMAPSAVIGGNSGSSSNSRAANSQFFGPSKPRAPKQNTTTTRTAITTTTITTTNGSLPMVSLNESIFHENPRRSTSYIREMLRTKPPLPKTSLRKKVMKTRSFKPESCLEWDNLVGNRTDFLSTNDLKQSDWLQGIFKDLPKSRLRIREPVANVTKKPRKSYYRTRSTM